MSGNAVHAAAGALTRNEDGRRHGLHQKGVEEVSFILEVPISRLLKGGSRRGKSKTRAWEGGQHGILVWEAFTWK